MNRGFYLFLYMVKIKKKERQNLTCFCFYEKGISRIGRGCRLRKQLGFDMVDSFIDFLMVNLLLMCMIELQVL